MASLTGKLPPGLRLAAWRAIRRAREYAQQRRRPHTVASADATYSADPPSPQSAVDIFKGNWTSAFPPEYGITAGSVDNFDDVRVRWAAGELPKGFDGLSILELGPYEAYNTWQFERLGARAVTAIEANDLNFLKCLIVKDVTGLKARFLFGDFIPFLERNTERFDLVWASGVLYHARDPLRLIELAARAADAVFLHTHYYVDAAARVSPHAHSFFDEGRNRVAQLGDRRVTLHWKAYGQMKRRDFSGGAALYSYWMEKEDIIAALRHCGLSKIRVGTDDPGNPNGPAMFCLATRR